MTVGSSRKREYSDLPLQLLSTRVGISHVGLNCNKALNTLDIASIVNSKTLNSFHVVDRRPPGSHPCDAHQNFQRFGFRKLLAMFGWI